jgi:hypothetical protein
MSEIHVITQYYCPSGKNCSYTIGFVDGYLLGGWTILLFLVIMEIILCVTQAYMPNINEDEEKEKNE